MSYRVLLRVFLDRVWTGGRSKSKIDDVMVIIFIFIFIFISSTITREGGWVGPEEGEFGIRMCESRNRVLLSSCARTRTRTRTRALLLLLLSSVLSLFPCAARWMKDTDSLSLLLLFSLSLHHVSPDRPRGLLFQSIDQSIKRGSEKVSHDATQKWLPG